MVGVRGGLVRRRAPEGAMCVLRLILSCESLHAFACNSHAKAACGSLKAGTAQKCGSGAYLWPGSNDALGSNDDLGSIVDLGSWEDMIERGESIIPRGII